MNDRRYEVVETGGFTATGSMAGHEIEISVVDGDSCGRVVATFYVLGRPESEAHRKRYYEARMKAEEHASRLNFEERVWEMTG